MTNHSWLPVANLQVVSLFLFFLFFYLWQIWVFFLLKIFRSKIKWLFFNASHFFVWKLNIIDLFSYNFWNVICARYNSVIALIVILFVILIINVLLFFSVKVGGMRVVQHKPPSHKEAASADLEDCTGLTVIIYAWFNKQ